MRRSIHPTGPDCTLRAGGFTCPRCLARLPTLPCSCFVCGLTCVLSPHIARSYHHLFPLPVFPDVPADTQSSLQGYGGTQTGPTENQGGHCSENKPVKAEPVHHRAEQIDPFVKVVLGHSTPLHCFGCLQPLSGDDGPELVTQCPDCCYLFCLECDGLLHDVVHNCPGCECLPLGAARPD